MWETFSMAIGTFLLDLGSLFLFLSIGIVCLFLERSKHFEHLLSLVLSKSALFNVLRFGRVEQDCDKIVQK